MPIKNTPLQDFLSHAYQGSRAFLEHVIFPMFGEDKFTDGHETEVLDNHPEYRKLADATGISSIKQVGRCDYDIEPLLIFDITVSNRVLMERNRVSIQRLIRQIMDTYSSAFMLFHYDDASRWDWRFTYCHKRGNQNEATDSKRYTFLLGPNYSCRTASENFQRLIDMPADAITVGHLEQAFSVEALTKAFYSDLFNWYLWAVDSESGITFPNDTRTDTDDRDDIEMKIIRMITRIMFVWFIKQKELVPDEIFDPTTLLSVLKDFDPMSTTEGTYYNAILQNLFFATLNRAIEAEDRSRRGFAHDSKHDIKTLYRYAELFAISEEEVVELFSEVPFLNGGLFECLDKSVEIDGVEQAYNFDGFSRNDERFPNGNYRHRAVVPNIFFFEPEKGLISILKRYNFTIEENSPQEQQVALDPELLGKIFENLLGAYNPETKETARKQSGSFYTPREVVNYMVDESLIAYLGDTDHVRALFNSNFTPDAHYEEHYRQIAQRLRAVKILDPACGSGAFPMGLLTRMVDLLQRITPTEETYALKLELIENCLYGNDIQPIAAQITKLRFFISLICECDKDPSKPNFGIPTLPNLETKFVTSDTLMAVSKTPTSRDLFEDPAIVCKQEELINVRRQHFLAKSAAKKMHLRAKDQTLREELGILLANSYFTPESAQQLAKWNPYDQNDVSPFFDPEWMFGLTDGFDIVIGNPPYLQLQNNAGALSQLYKNRGYDTFASSGDIYCLFYERGCQLLKPKGHLCYITSNKWMRAGYGEKTRRFLATQTNPKRLIDFAGVKVFESATVDTNILLLERAANQQATICAIASKHTKDSLKDLSLFVQQEHVVCDFGTSESWVILSPIEQSIKRKIEAVGIPLREWDIQINYGIKTGYNEAFIISTEKRNEILANCQSEEERQRTAELIRPILRGRDIKRYGYEWAEKYLIATFPSRHYDIEQYPAVNQYLLSFGKERLEQTGKSYIINGEMVKARKKTNNKWFETQDSISYWEDFFKPKITWGNLNLQGTYAYAPKGMFVNAPSPFIATENIAILHILNSKIADYYIRSLGVTRNGGYFEYKPMFVDKLPIPKDGLEELQNYKEQPSVNEEMGISKIIYQLYGLNSEEIEYVESREF